jgi:hypothetical protein
VFAGLGIDPFSGNVLAGASGALNIVDENISTYGTSDLICEVPFFTGKHHFKVKKTAISV